MADTRSLIRMVHKMFGVYCDSFKRPPKKMVLDIDETFDEVHGDQQLSLFNGYYGGLSISIPMTEEEMSPLRKRMVEDMRIREMRNKRQNSHFRAIKDFAAFLGHSPDAATPEELRAYNLQHAHRCTVFLFRYHLRAGGDEAVHAGPIRRCIRILN